MLFKYKHMKIICTLSFFLMTTFVSAADTKVYYHAFPMGQGSSSFVRYHSADGKNDWGVVFDMGSSSTNVHKKFHFQNKKDMCLLELKGAAEKGAPEKLLDSSDDADSESQPSSSGSDASRGEETGLL